MGADLRRTMRYRVDLECDVQVLLPTETFHPQSEKGRILDLSGGGAGVSIPGYPEASFRRLLGGNGYVKIRVGLGSAVGRQREELRLIGRIVWMDYHSRPACLNVGAAFDPADKGAPEVVAKILALLGVS